MVETLLFVIVLLLLALLALTLFRKQPAPPVDLTPVLDKVEAGRRDIVDALRRESELSRQHASIAAVELRDEVRKSQTSFAESLAKNISALSEAQQAYLATFAQRLDVLTQSSAESAAKQREEAARTLKEFSDSLLKQLTHSAQQQTQQFDAFAHRLSQFGQATTEQLDKGRVEAANSAKATRDDVMAQLKLISETMAQRQTELAAAQKTQLEDLAKQVKGAMEASQQQAELLRQAVEKQLTAVREDNTKQLEQMRATVDEKLQGTLDKRLGESFKLVSERLEQVHKGLGEMQTLALGVGDLKKVLSNVKVRGNWGEVQLGNLLEQTLTKEQYALNVAVTGEGRERVEFAIKLPGQNDGEKPVWLPIDAKFPQEDYQRLVDASERADAEGVEAASKALADRVWGCARDIRDKYIKAPLTTDFGILFLPTEGLYAEVLRRAGLAEAMQRELKIVIAGPTTITALLNSLQMGFRTLAIQKQSSEVWKVLGAVKADFGKFEGVLDSVKRKLESATTSIDDAHFRTVQIGKKLRKVEELPANEAQAILGLPDKIEADEEG